MKWTVLLTAFYLVSFSLVAKDISHAEAYKAASKMEETLDQNDMYSLFMARGQLISDAVPSCISKRATAPTNISVVIELDETGLVKRMWSDNQSLFGLCFEKEIVTRFKFKAPKAPFYTLIEITDDNQIEFNYD
ncbi:hypothetical protein [Kangiella geojedonensis]|uniref:Uncharacterized protein n=1 Tax=Kangiella geojedonensis TaxID=914150 RepID=A0A0F6RBQ0_9GAMM|nr:hypothetical protein [Kangiella geojedonensis]AKE51773.1 hypothetical protein TQ33_0800 [Kangiella geojedonensis]